MNCSNCNTPLNPGSNTCPNCGALNLAFDQQFNAQTADSFSPAVDIPSDVVNNVSVEESAFSGESVVSNVSEQPVNQALPQFNNNNDIILEDGPASTEVVQTVENNVVESIPEVTVTENVIQPTFVQEVTPEIAPDTLENLSDDNLNDVGVQVAENTLPPELDVEKENMTEGVKDISQANVSTYEVEPMEEKTEETAENKEEQLDIAIPKVETPVDSSNVPTDGSAPEMATNKTVGSETKAEELEEKIEVKHKKLINFNFSGKSNMPKPLMIGGLVLVLIVGVFIGATLFSKNLCSIATVKKTNISKNTVSDGKNNVTKAGSYTFKIPQDYIYDKKDKGLLIYDNQSSWRIYLRADAGLYNDIASAKTSVRETMAQTGIDINNIKETKVNDSLYMIIEGVTKTTTRLIAFTDAGNDNIFYVEIVTEDNNINYDLLEVADDILRNAEYDDTVTKIETITVHDVTDLAILAAQEYKSRINN